MNRLKASSRYAAAYFTAMEREHISEEKKEIEDFLEYLNNDIVFKKFLISPSFDKFKKINILNELKDRKIISNKLCNYLKIILDNKRSFYLVDILEETVKEADNIEGIKCGICYTTFELSNEMKNKLTSAISKKLKAEVKLKFILQKNLIGGVKIFIDDRLFDSSLIAMNDTLKTQVEEGE